MQPVDNQRVIALDLSLTASGYCDGEVLKVWRPSKLKGHERLDAILREVNKAVTEVKPAAVFIEGFSFGSRGSSTYEIGGLGYLIRHALWMRQVPYAEVPPSVLKKYATGRGNANKEDMLAAAIRRFGYTAEAENNMVDAFLLWHLAQQHAGTPVVEVPLIQQMAAVNVIWGGAR